MCPAHLTDVRELKKDECNGVCNECSYSSACEVANPQVLQQRSWKHHLICLTYQTSQLNITVPVGNQLFTLVFSRLAESYCLLLKARSTGWGSQIAKIENYENSNLKGFLLNNCVLLLQHWKVKKHVKKKKDKSL